MFKPMLIALVGIGLLTGCSKASKNIHSSKNGSLPQTFDPLAEFVVSEEDLNKLPQDQQDFYHQLNPSVQTVFLSLSSEEREDAVAMTTPMLPEEAITRAAHFDVYSLPLDQQMLYFKLNEQMRPLFLALAVDTTDEAIKLAKDFDPNQAVQKAAKEEINQYPATYQDLFNQLDINGQALFLVLTPQAKEDAVMLAETVNPGTAVQNVSWVDAKRLPKDQQEFYLRLNPENKTQFLILTPPARSLALLLIKSLDPNTAVRYADRRSFQHIQEG